MADLDRVPLSVDTTQWLIGTMNSRYKDALKAFAKHFCGKGDVATAQIIEIQETKFLFRYWDAEDNYNDAAIHYQDHVGDSITASSAGDFRRILVDMARTVSEATGDNLDLPCGASVGSNESDEVPGAYLLNDLVDMNTVECLNQDDAHPVTNAISKSLADAESVADAVLQSDPDVDHQLLIKLGFRQPVKLKAITFRGKTEDESAPQTVKVFHGQMHIGFQEADDQQAVQTLSLSASLIDAGHPITLHFVKFQHVTSLQLFVQSNFGAEVTRIEQLQFWGSPAEVVDMKGFKPTADNFANPIVGVIEPPKDEPNAI